MAIGNQQKMVLKIAGSADNLIVLTTVNAKLYVTLYDTFYGTLNGRTQ